MRKYLIQGNYIIPIENIAGIEKKHSDELKEDRQNYLEVTLKVGLGLQNKYTVVQFYGEDADLALEQILYP